ncbi:metal-dependent hydrolase [Sporomusa sp.]|uniref:metal-dependent hydrolase n=1 Tax=Sporomusa sp. TaxID=2078658 RepID=UPI002B6CB5C2|nr:metal-dependent hydrolase [Sporomusa sp.]HWR41546.1 metal-dependent hydrolase [Sporomusa sp.]
MDTLSHALVGIAVAGLSGHPLSFGDPLYLASIIGAQAPDFDIIAQIRGNFSYLRQHRAFSHSIPGLVMWSGLITAGFFLCMPDTPLAQVFIWSFLGGLSHICIDFFNAHGAAILFPFSRERKSFSLLNVFDPFLLTIMLTVFLQGLTPRETSLLFFASVGLYTLLRYLLKLRATILLRQHFINSGISRILVMPSLRSVFCWDFVIETANHYYVGQIGALQPVLTLHTELLKQTLSPALQGAQKTVLGEFFSSFTPFSYFTEYQDTDQHAKHVRIYDLRYFFNQGFLHSATIIYGHDEQPCDSYIQTYGRKIKIPC